MLIKYQNDSSHLIFKVSSPDSGLINVGHYIEMRKVSLSVGFQLRPTVSNSQSIKGQSLEEGKLPRSLSHDSYIGNFLYCIYVCYSESSLLTNGDLGFIP